MNIRYHNGIGNRELTGYLNGKRVHAGVHFVVGLLMISLAFNPGGPLAALSYIAALLSSIGCIIVAADVLENSPGTYDVPGDLVCGLIYHAATIVGLSVYVMLDPATDEGVAPMLFMAASIAAAVTVGCIILLVSKQKNNGGGSIDSVNWTEMRDRLNNRRY